MSRQLEAVTFDLDGTLLDTMTVAPLAYTNTIRALDGPDLTPDDITQVWHIGPTATVLNHFLRRPITPTDLDLFHATFETALSATEPFNGVADMLDVLHEHGYRLGIYTTATHRAATMMLTTTGLADRFHGLIGGDQAAHPKPAPDGLIQLAQQLSTTPSKVAYVGDTDIDTQCADAAQSIAILATWGTPDVNHDPMINTAQTPQEVVAIVLDAARDTPPHRPAGR